MDKIEGFLTSNFIFLGRPIFIYERPRRQHSKSGGLPLQTRVDSQILLKTKNYVNFVCHNRSTFEREHFLHDILGELHHRF